MQIYINLEGYISHKNKQRHQSLVSIIYKIFGDQVNIDTIETVNDVLNFSFTAKVYEFEVFKLKNNFRNFLTNKGFDHEFTITIRYPNWGVLMIPKAYDDELLNMLNLMSAPTKERTFLGFIKIEGKLDYWGVDLEESCICGVYMFNTPQKRPVADDVGETDRVSRNYPYVLFFHGNDNTSYIKRFKLI